MEDNVEELQGDSFSISDNTVMKINVNLSMQIWNGKKSYLLR